jgi:hypothetical protein
VLAGIFLAFNPNQPNAMRHLYWSVWILLWTVYGAVSMTLLANVALDHLPWRGQHAPRPPLWIYIFPVTLFISCLSPYVGLKTESSIAMFSNLRTEGGDINHYLFDKPPYLFHYQDETVRILAASHHYLQPFVANQQGMVMFDFKEFLRRHPDDWVTYSQNGKVYEKATFASFAAQPQANLIERNLLIFKPVEFRRPQVCTH